MTITLNGKGEATYVLVSSRQGFGNRGQGMSRPDGQNGANGKTERETQEPSDNQNNA